MFDSSQYHLVIWVKLAKWCGTRSTLKERPIFLWFESILSHDSAQKGHDSSQCLIMIRLKLGSDWRRICDSLKHILWFDSQIHDSNQELVVIRFTSFNKFFVPLCLVWFDSGMCVIRIAHLKSQKPKFSAMFLDSTFGMILINLNYSSCSTKLD